MKELFPELEGVGCEFRPYKALIPANRRTLWRVALLLCILKLASRGGKSSLIRLQVLDWGAMTAEGAEQILSFLDGAQRAIAAVRYDPALVRAVQYAKASKLVCGPAKKIEITEAGEAMVTEILNNQAILKKEIRILSAIGKRLTEKAVNEFMLLGSSI